MTTPTAQTKSAKVREQLDHPVVDADGHWVELFPVYFDYIAEVGGPAIQRRGRGPLAAVGDDLTQQRQNVGDVGRGGGGHRLEARQRFPTPSLGGGKLAGDMGGLCPLQKTIDDGERGGGPPMPRTRRARRVADRGRVGRLS